MNPLLQKLMHGPPSANAADSALAPGYAPRRSAISRVSYTHEAMVDAIIANPCISGDELSEMFGYSPSWISTILHSDIFQSKLAARRDQLVDPEIRSSIKAQFSGLLVRSMEVLRRKLDVPPELVPDQLAVQVAKLAGTSLGFGVKETKVSVSETHLHLTELGDNLVGLLRQRKAEAQAPALTHDRSSLASFVPSGRTIEHVQEQRTNTPELRPRESVEQDQGHSGVLPAPGNLVRGTAGS